MKNKLIFILFLFLYSGSFAQTNIDSLWNVWGDETEEDSSRLYALDRVIWKGVLFKKPDSAAVLSTIQIKYCSKLSHSPETEFLGFSWMGRGYVSRSITNIFLSDYPSAITDLDSALYCYTHTNESDKISDVHSKYGIVYGKMGNYDLSIEHLNISLQYYRETNNLKGVSNILNSLGVNLMESGHFKEALEKYHECLAINNEIDYHKKESNVLANIGQTYKLMYNYEKALEYLTKSMEIDIESGNERGISYSLRDLGDINVRLGNYEKAIDMFNQSILIDTKHKNRRGLSRSYRNLGGVLAKYGNYHKSIYYHNKGLKLRRETGDNVGVSYSLNSIGNVYLAKHEYRDALKYYRESFEMKIQTKNNTGLNSTLSNLATAYAGLGIFDSAIYYLDSSVNFCINNDLEIVLSSEYNAYAKCYLVLGEYEKALEYNLYSEQLNDSTGIVSDQLKTNYTFTIIHEKLGDFKKSEYHLKKLLEIRNADLERNFMLLTESQKEMYFEKFRKEYTRMFELAQQLTPLDPDYTAYVYDQILWIKGLQLRSSFALRNNILSSQDSVLITQFNNWIALKREITQAFSSGENPLELIEKAEDIEKNLIMSSNVFDEFSKSQNTSWTDVQSMLDKDEAAVEMIHFTRTKQNDQEEVIYAALVNLPNKDQPIYVELCTGSELEQLIGINEGNNYQQIAKVYGNLNEPNEKLYTLIWSPLEKVLNNATTIHISPSGLMHKISFAAIITPRHKYLSETYTIRIVNSTANILDNNNRKISDSAQFTFFGGANFSLNKNQRVIWEDLPGTAEECAKSSSILQGTEKSVVYFEGNNASELNFRAQVPKSNIIHIASHGFFFPNPDDIAFEYIDDSLIEFRSSSPIDLSSTLVNNENPLFRTGFVLSGANDSWNDGTSNTETDGILTANELSSIALTNCNLIVLSACETGLGDISSTEGVYGLQRALKMAGAQKIIMSLWKVPDIETAEFMKLFYSKLSKTGDIEMSFMWAQGKMRKKYDPYYWAAFVLLN
jgi:CHAT domain-containing protein/lipopolysaccharide biosynthesis regulator YciM